MCGIAAIIAPDATGRRPALEAMLGRILHRGPDATGVLVADGCAFAHARLAVIDLAGGDQPMRDASERFAITYNGEIYNYRELRDELRAAGHRFITSSDTEVILAAWQEWGSGCVDRFRGMFAFAIWDRQERSLFAARDLFGEKPFYFVHDGERLLIASELKAIVASRLVEPRLSMRAVDAYLALGYLPPEVCIYDNVRTLPPAHYLTFAGDRVTTTRYWAPTPRPQPMTLDDAAAEVRRLMQQAVARQLVADTPVGAFLSGGHDSSTIVALMAGSGITPKTFSVGFEFDNELPFAAAVARQYATEHHELDLASPPVGALLERMASVYDEPIGDSSHIPTFLVAEYARSHVKVVLGGDGGDELFGGYGWHSRLDRARQARGGRLRWLLLRAAAKATRQRALDASSDALGLKVRWPDPWRAAIMARIVLSAGERRALWRSGANDSGIETSAGPGSDVQGLDRGFYFDLTNYLSGDLLVKVDRAAMAHGLETRTPFLDRDLAEFALSIPADLKVRGDERRIVYREAFAPLWPEVVRRRSKRGFSPPIAKWLQREDVRPLLARVYAAGSPLRRLLPGLPSAPRNDRPLQTWTLLSLGLWLG